MTAFTGTLAELADCITKIGDDKAAGTILLQLWNAGYRSGCLDAAALVRSAIITEELCETCKGTGEIDQRIGGEWSSSVVKCPDCITEEPTP